MFWLHKAAIISPYVSENIKRKLYTCSHVTFTHTLGKDEISAIHFIIICVATAM